VHGNTSSSSTHRPHVNERRMERKPSQTSPRQEEEAVTRHTSSYAATDRRQKSSANKG